ncbi:AraC family transcriptional regulator [Aquibium carbonis]|uniref:AraC family transcriptional regulator n=1 Tax=Aquibium carbonis TaxID=2495581 RepID=A0A3R9YAN8_9HYPH|nr:helix-turn-helix transcriptional regulator [Aquibium carbonis]RST88007.1 AraC family transcriptional regulator [Aquibium carbonis]
MSSRRLAISDAASAEELHRRLDWIEAAAGDVIASAGDYPDGHKVALHSHRRSQLLHALSGVVLVSTAQGRWIVPPDHSMWIPAGIAHAVEMLGEVRMRSAYVLPEAAPGLPGTLHVLAMTRLMCSLVVEAVELQADVASDERASAIMRLILLEIPRLPVRPFALPLPSDERLARLCRAFLDAPTPHVTIDDWADSAGMSRRGFTRAFQRETGLSLSLWRRQATLLAALPRLSSGVPVTTVAFDLGYDSAPAFTTMFRQMLGTSPRGYLAARERDLIVDVGVAAVDRGRSPL